MSKMTKIAKMAIFAKSEKVVFLGYPLLTTPDHVISGLGGCPPGYCPKVVILGTPKSDQKWSFWGPRAKTPSVGVTQLVLS